MPVELVYGSKTAITMTLANLASDTNLLAGRESSQIDNTSNKFVQVWVQGQVFVGTTPTANRQITVYVWGSDTSAASATNLDVLDGTDSNETITNAQIRNSLLTHAQTADVVATTSDIAYPFKFEVSALFGGVMPKYWGLFVVHNTGVNLRNNAVNNDSFSYTGISYADV